MSLKRVAVYLVCATVLAAWLASAAGVIQQPVEPAPAPVPVQTSGSETLAEEVQAQARRLRDRLAAAPTPQRPARNPFAFAERPAPRAMSAPPTRMVQAPPVALPPPEPVLLLVGIAEDQAPSGPVRTAILTAEGGETILIRAGESIGGRYRVQAVGQDAVELLDLATGAIRRLALR